MEALIKSTELGLDRVVIVCADNRLVDINLQQTHKDSMAGPSLTNGSPQCAPAGGDHSIFVCN